MPEYVAAPNRNVSSATVDDVARFNAALKAMQLLGQVLKNFPASFDGPQKVDMASSCMRLGLRCLGFYFELVKQDEKQLLIEVSEMLALKKKGMSDAETKEQAKAFVRWMSRHMSFAITKRISHAIGSKELTKTYERIFSECESDAHALVELSLLLDHQGEFPETVVKRRFSEWDKKNTFASHQVRLLVRRNFKLFDVPPATKQSIAQCIGIELKAEHNEVSRSKLTTRQG